MWSSLSFNLSAARENYESDLAKLRATGAIVPDLLAPMLSATALEPVYFQRDHHWTAFGAETAARAIAASIAHGPDFPNSRLKFNLINNGIVDFVGSYAQIVEDLCHIKSDPEARTVRSTVLAATGASDLLASLPTPKIVLVGTSFSMHHNVDLFDFAGALERATGEEVLNQAIDGGGQSSSLDNYLTQTELLGNKPAYIVWEVGAGLRFPSGESNARRILGEMNGLCDNNLIASI